MKHGVPSPKDTSDRSRRGPRHARLFVFCFAREGVEVPSVASFSGMQILNLFLLITSYYQLLSTKYCFSSNKFHPWLMRNNPCPVAHAQQFRHCLFAIDAVV